MRSFTEPPGLRYSSFARCVLPVSRPIVCSRTIGVWPTSSSAVGYSRGTTEGYGNTIGAQSVRIAMNITTIGKGNIGSGLARLWEQAGHTVTTLGREGGDASNADV